MSSTRRLAALNQHVTVSTVAEVGEYDSHDDNHLRVNEVRLARRWSSAQQAVGRRCRGVACLAVAWPLLGGCRCNGRCCYMWRYLLLPPRVPLPLLPPLPPASARCCRAPRSHSLARSERPLRTCNSGQPSRLADWEPRALGAPRSHSLPLTPRTPPADVRQLPGQGRARDRRIDRHRPDDRRGPSRERLVSPLRNP